MTKPEATPDPGERPSQELIEYGIQQALQRSLPPPASPSALAADPWAALPDDAGAPAGGSNLRAYVHALRRRWLSAGFLGAICATAAVAAVWVTKTPTYTATAILRVSTQQESLVFDLGNSGSRGDFAVYKSTQQQLIKSDFVLIAALRNPEVSNLPVIKAEPDPVRYLTEELRVDFPGDSELMTVKISGQDSQEVTTLVNAVVDAYLAEVVDRERNSRQTRMKELDDLYTLKAEEVRGKLIQLKNLADQFGTSDSDALAMQQQIAFEQFAAFRRESVRAQFEARRIQGELTIQKALVEKLGETEAAGGDFGIDQTDVDAVARTDPFVIERLNRQRELTEVIGEHERRTVNGQVSTFLEGYRRELEQVNKQIAEGHAAIREELRRRRRSTLEARVAELTNQLAIASEQEKQLAADLDASRSQAEKLGGSSIDVEIMRADIGRLETDILNPLAQERERLRVELQTPSRVQLFQAARRPTSADDDNFLAKLLMAAMVCFGLPVAGILFLDVRTGRVNSPTDVTRTLGIQVLGTMPPFRPSRRGLRLAAQSTRRQQRVREAVNGIIARLLHETQHATSRVVLVTSATSGEGKTTLSTQLATALAHIGYRTLLVDFDLRRPSLARLFGVPAAPGVSELLRGETTLEDTFQPTEIPGLTLMPAGFWLSHSFAVLANGSTTSFFDQVRRQFDFVVVDGSPILPVAEARMVARHADRVVLSVLRDVSRGPQVLSAWETLTAFGAATVEAVVTGFYQDVYYEQSEPHHESNATSPKHSTVEVT